MGLYVHLSWPTGPVSPDESWDDVFSCASLLLDAMGKHFTPKSAELWRWATQAELGGERLAQHSVAASYRPARTNLPLGTYHGILRVLGRWKAPGTPEGYLSINRDRTWAETYGDLEMDAFPSRATGGLAEMISAGQLPKSIVHDAFRVFHDFYGEQARKVRVAYFAASPDADHNIGDALAFYAGDSEDFLALGLKTLKSEEAFKNSDDAKNLQPFSEPFVLATIRKVPEVQQRLSMACRAAGVDVSRGSYVYVGKRIGSFAQAYRSVRNSVLVPALGALPKRTNLVRDIEHAITGQTSLRSRRRA